MERSRTAEHGRGARARGTESGAGRGARANSRSPFGLPHGRWGGTWLHLLTSLHLGDLASCRSTDSTARAGAGDLPPFLRLAFSACLKAFSASCSGVLPEESFCEAS